MKKYESPVVLQFADLAEGIYAASGTEVQVEKEDECWSVNVNVEQVVAHEGYANLRVKAEHPGTVHISTKSTVYVVFNQAITDAYFDAGTATANGVTVTIERESHANAYGVKDNYDCLLKVYCANPSELQVVSSTIVCTKAPNVQGGF